MLVPLIVGTLSTGVWRGGRGGFAAFPGMCKAEEVEITSAASQLRSLLVRDSLSRFCSSFRLLICYPVLSFRAYSVMIRPPLVTFTCHMQLSSHLPLDSSQHQMTSWIPSSWKNTQFGMQ